MHRRVLVALVVLLTLNVLAVTLASPLADVLSAGPHEVGKRQAIGSFIHFPRCICCCPPCPCDPQPQAPWPQLPQLPHLLGQNPTW
ncbi:hypothetical protein V1264_024705 [Littorina saxatilis]|uniref:Uncharacterized protein n=1 Tax=Littorina saxatilis TaxID=31220 RepID=A0AAN9FZZ0_9CAEN